MPWLSWCCTEQTGALLGKVWPYWADWGHAGAVLGRLGLLWAGYAGVVQGLFWADGDCTGDTGTPFPMHPCCALPPTVPVRLVGGRSRCHGRVELLQDGAWGSICASGWDRAASRVLCRELGCGRPRLIPAPCSPPAADGPPVTLQRVQCSGQEPALAHCVLQPRDAPSCPSDRLAAVDCEGERVEGCRALALEWGGGLSGPGLTPNLVLQSHLGCGCPGAPGGARGGWRCSATGAGARCATTAGARRTRRWCARSWAAGRCRQTSVGTGRVSGPAPGASGWMTCGAGARRGPCRIVPTEPGGTTTAPTTRMSAWSARTPEHRGSAHGHPRCHHVLQRLQRGDPKPKQDPAHGCLCPDKAHRWARELLPQPLMPPAPLLKAEQP
uniref:SRCR domain-containing protein n=1 Tax=Cairina moschata TaxID=8855 RepID=A0A8C3GMS8_CAIMO